MLIYEASYSVYFRSYDTQHNYNHLNDIQHNNIQHNDAQHNNNENATLSIMTLSIMVKFYYAECY